MDALSIVVVSAEYLCHVEPAPQVWEPVLADQHERSRCPEAEQVYHRLPAPAKAAQSPAWCPSAFLPKALRIVGQLSGQETRIGEDSHEFAYFSYRFRYMWRRRP